MCHKLPLSLSKRKLIVVSLENTKHLSMPSRRYNVCMYAVKYTHGKVMSHRLRNTQYFLEKLQKTKRAPDTFCSIPTKTMSTSKNIPYYNQLSSKLTTGLIVHKNRYNTTSITNRLVRLSVISLRAKNWAQIPALQPE